jgi:hypothetical protein
MDGKRWCHRDKITELLLAHTNEHPESLAERGGLETAVSREVLPKENPCGYWRNLGSKFASIVQRVSSLSVRYDARCQP